MFKMPKLSAIQKPALSTAKKAKNPKLNPGFNSLPKEVQKKIMDSKKPKMMGMKKPPMAGMKKPPLSKKKSKK
jgi:hypothetical protein